MKHAFIRLADTLSPLIPNPSPPEYRREKGARSIKVLVFGNSNPTTTSLLLNTVSPSHPEPHPSPFFNQVHCPRAQRLPPSIQPRETTYRGHFTPVLYHARRLAKVHCPQSLAPNLASLGSHHA